MMGVREWRGEGGEARTSGTNGSLKRIVRSRKGTVEFGISDVISKADNGMGLVVRQSQSRIIGHRGNG